MKKDVLVKRPTRKILPSTRVVRIVKDATDKTLKTNALSMHADGKNRKESQQELNGKQNTYPSMPEVRMQKNQYS